MQLRYVDSPWGDPEIIASHSEEQVSSSAICSDDSARYHVSDVCSSDSASASHKQPPESTAIDVYSFASKKPDGWEHHGANARAPDANARTLIINKLIMYKPRLPIRLIETHIRFTANSDPSSCSDSLLSSRESCASEVG